MSRARPVVFLTHTPTDLELFFDRDALADLESFANVRVNPSGKRLSQQALKEAAADADVIVSEFKTGATASVLSLPKLKAFVRSGVELVNVDVRTATECHVLVVNTPGQYATAVAEYTIGLILCLARRFVDYHEMVASGRLRESLQTAAARGDAPAEYGLELADETLGIIGLGAVGRRVSVLAEAFGMHVLAYDPYVDYEEGLPEIVSLRTLLRRSRFVSVHCKLTDETRHLLDAEKLKLLRRDAYIINTSRGPIIDETALAHALRQGRLAGAAIDVYEQEPDFSRSPLIGLPGIITTPHAAGHTRGSVRRQARAAVEAVRNIVRGRVPAGVVNPEVIDSWLKKWASSN